MSCLGSATTPLPWIPLRWYTRHRQLRQRYLAIQELSGTAPALPSRFFSSRAPDPCFSPLNPQLTAVSNSKPRFPCRVMFSEGLYNCLLSLEVKTPKEIKKVIRVP